MARDGIHRIAAAIAAALLFTGFQGSAETEADRDALLAQAEILATPWDSPLTEDGDGSAALIVHGIAPLPDGSILAVLAPETPEEFYWGDGFDQLVRLDPADGARTVLSTGAGYTHIAVAGGQGLVAVADRDSAALFSLEDLTAPEEEWEGLDQNAALVFLSDGGMLASGGRDARVHLLNVEWQDRDRPLLGHAGSVTALAPGGALLFSAGADGAVKVWDPKAGVLVKTLRPGGSRVVALQTGGGGRSLYAVREDGTVLVYDLANYRPSSWDTGLGAVTLCAFSLDGRLAAFYDGGDTVAVWDLKKSRETERLSAGVASEHALTALAFSWESGRVLMGYSDGAVSARVLDSRLLELLAAAGLSEMKRSVWLGERRLALGDAAEAARLFQAAGDASGIARAGRALLEADAADAAEALFRRSADREGLERTGRYYLEHGAWAAALRCLSDTLGRTAAAAAIGDAAFDAQSFEDALEYYMQAADAGRLSRLAQALFVRRDYSGSAGAYSRAGDKAGLRRAAEALFKAGSRTEAARLLLDAGDAATVSAWAASLLAAGNWGAGGEICVLLKDVEGARRAAAALLAAKEPEQAFRIHLAIGDRAAAKAIPDGMVAEGSRLFRALESFLELETAGGKLGELFSGAAELYEIGQMMDEVTASLPAFVKNYDYIFPMVWYSSTGQEERIKGVADAAFSFGVLIASLVGYSAVEDEEGISKVAQAMMRTGRYKEAAVAYGRLDDDEGRNAAAAALMAAGDVKTAEEIYKATGSSSGLSALAASAQGTGDAKEAAELYAQAGNTAAILAMAQAAEKKSGPAAAVELYALMPDPAAVKREAARLIEAGFYAEGRRLLEAADDAAGLAALAGRYAALGVLDEALEIYVNIDDYEGVNRIRALQAGTARTAGGGRQTAETADAKKKRAAAAMNRRDYAEAAVAYGELGDYTGFLRALKAILEAGDSAGARGLAERFRYRPAFLAVAQAAEEAEEWSDAFACYREAGDGESARALAYGLLKEDIWDASQYLDAFVWLEDKEGLAAAARVLLTEEGPYGSRFETYYQDIVSSLGDESASRLADEFLKEGSFRFPVVWYVGREDHAGIARCAAAALEAEGSASLAAALYALIGDREGLLTTAKEVLGLADRWDRDEPLARAIARKLGDRALLSRCAAYRLEELQDDYGTDYREPARLYLEAGDAAGILAAAEAFAAARRPLQAAHWARAAGNAAKTAAFLKQAPAPAAARVRLRAERTSDIDYDGSMPVWWHELAAPLPTEPDESEFAQEIRGTLEEDGFVVMGEGEGDCDVELTIRVEKVETQALADRIVFRMANAKGTVLLDVDESGLETSGHALIGDLPAVVRQRLAE